MNNKKQQTRLKIRFYIMSLWLLFLLMFVLTVNVSCIFYNGQFTGIHNVLRRNWLSSINLFFLALGFIFAKRTEYEWAGAKNPPYKVKSVKNENYEYLTFLTTCIIPLLCIDLERKRNVFVMVILLIAIGVIFVRMDLYYGNPTLALMGYRISRVKIDNPNVTEDIILISKDCISPEQLIKWIEVDNNIWIAKVVNNDKR